IRKIDRVTNIITTVAGSAGDGIPATASVLLLPRGVVKDSAGNVFVADQANHRIRKIDAVTKLISTIAGTGFGGFSGDGGPATAATLLLPEGVSVDAAGNLYIADSGHDRIRRVDRTTNIITTVAGSASNFLGDGGLATDAMLFDPIGIAFDSAANLY